MADKLCPCGSGLNYDECCEPYIKGVKDAPTAEAVMRSRYSAYAKDEIDYIVASCSPNTPKEEKIDVKETRKWAEGSVWQGLTIIATSGGGAADEKGVVEFKAVYKNAEGLQTHHERAEFEKVGGKWYYVTGRLIVEQYRRETAKVGRNDPCPCGSGKKYKLCHGR